MVAYARAWGSACAEAVGDGTVLACAGVSGRAPSRPTADAPSDGGHAGDHTNRMIERRQARSANPGGVPAKRTSRRRGQVVLGRDELFGKASGSAS